MEYLPVIFAVFAGGAALFYSFRWFFACGDDFYEAIRHWLTPDLISMFRGEWAEDQWNEFKLFAWILVGGLAGYGAYHLTESLLS